MGEAIAVAWMSTTEVCEALGLSTPTLRRLIDEGHLPAYRFGRVFRVKVTDVDAFIDSCKIQPGTLWHLHPGTRDERA